MGGCATKPKVSKDDADHAKPNPPEPEPEPELQLQPQKGDAVDDDQANKRRSLSLLFNNEKEDTNVSTENEESAAVKETEKPSEDTKNNDPIAKQESPKTEETLSGSGESKISEPPKQEPLPVELEDKSSVQIQSNKLVEETASAETLEYEKKPSEETQSSSNTVVRAELKTENPSEENQRGEPPKQLKSETTTEPSSRVAEETSIEETQNSEPKTKQEELCAAANASSNERSEAGKPSEEPQKNDSKDETLIEEATSAKVVAQNEVKIIEALFPDGGSVQKATEEPSREDQNQNQVEHASESADVSSIKT